MKKSWLFLLVILCKIEAYDPSFSDIIREVYAEYHQTEGDWCDLLSIQIQSIVAKKQRSVSFEELQKEGVDPEYLDAMAIEYCKKYEDAYIAIVWPTLDESYEEIVYDILSNECLVAYKKTFVLKHQARKPLMESIPEKRPHISFDLHCYFTPERKEYEMRCFVLRAPSQEATVRAKRVLRDLVKLNPYCMHVNDTHPQAMDLAYMLLNNNSLHYLNNHVPQQFETFSFLVGLYSEFLINRDIPEKDVCVDGSSILSAYGIRDSALDFDFLCTKFGDFGEIHPLDHHNSAWEKVGLPINDVIYNPKNFFYYKGYKFTSLMKLREFKSLQARPKDIVDVSMIDNLGKL